MYSESVTAASIAALEKGLALKLIRYAEADSLARAESVANAADAQGKPARALTPSEQSFIRNERLLSRVDFLYWLRYCHGDQDGGGFGILHLWESQKILLKLMATVEEEMAERGARGDTVDGILVAMHKGGRQLGATMIGRALTMHRITTSSHVRAMAASVDDDKIMELYDRDKKILASLPWWLRPSIEFDEKAAHIYFGKLVTRILYQTSVQKSGVGQGRQFDLGHVTEVSSFSRADIDLEHNYFPTIPQSRTSLSLLETTAQGRAGWWYEFVKGLRVGLSRRWRLLFIPYYIEKSKYNATPPAAWTPTDLSLKHAQMVYETSPEYTGGHAVMLSREKLYWWESTRAEYQARNSLALFYSNYAATVEESFQMMIRSAFSYEYLEAARLAVRDGKPYTIESVAAA